MYQVKSFKGCLPQVLLGLFLMVCHMYTYVVIKLTPPLDLSQGRNLFQPSVAFHIETSHLFFV